MAYGGPVDSGGDAAGGDESRTNPVVESGSPSEMVPLPEPKHPKGSGSSNRVERKVRRDQEEKEPSLVKLIVMAVLEIVRAIRDVMKPKGGE